MIFLTISKANRLLCIEKSLNPKINKLYISGKDGDNTDIRESWVSGTDQLVIPNVNRKEAEYLLSKIEQIKTNNILASFSELL